jgi:hypothetical protein
LCEIYKIIILIIDILIEKIINNILFIYINFSFYTKVLILLIKNLTNLIFKFISILLISTIITLLELIELVIFNIIFYKLFFFKIYFKELIIFFFLDIFDVMFYLFNIFVEEKSIEDFYSFIE